jgi:hypothetical protein
VLLIRPRRYSSSDRNDDDDDRGDATDDFPASLSATRADLEEIGGRGVVLGLVVVRRREPRRDEVILTLRHTPGPGSVWKEVDQVEWKKEEESELRRRGGDEEEAPERSSRMAGEKERRERRPREIFARTKVRGGRESRLAQRLRRRRSIPRGWRAHPTISDSCSS